jgi:hypothetical protein
MVPNTALIAFAVKHMPFFREILRPQAFLFFALIESAAKGRKERKRYKPGRNFSPSFCVLCALLWPSLRSSAASQDSEDQEEDVHLTNLGPRSNRALTGS